MGDAIPRNNFIVDNDVVGAANWTNDQLGADGFNGGEGIELTGSGHVVCFNHVRGFRDDISLMEYDEAYEQVSIDICNNDIEQATDDGIEADSGMGNVRVVRNRIRNCFDGCSSQPTLGGPNYYLRNVMYNVLYSPFKFHNGTVGDVVLHNTIVKCGDAYGCYAGETWSRAFFRNNIFIGGAGGGTFGGYANGTGRIFQLVDADATCSFDYDGVGAIGITTFNGKIGGKSFTSLATLQTNTTEAHAVQVDMGIFAMPVTFPSTPFPPMDAPDLRIAAAGAAADRGLPITGINDGFAGAAPDLGAYEAGQALPVYGPRSPGAGGTGGSTTPTGGTTGATSVGSTAAPTGGTIAPVGGTSAVGPLAGTTAAVPTGGAVATGGAESTEVLLADAGVSDPTAKSGKSGCSCDVGSAPSHPFASALLVLAALLFRRPPPRKSHKRA
jgi:MYXO-CTERM domain-containing protein